MRTQASVPYGTSGPLELEQVGVAREPLAGDPQQGPGGPGVAHRPECANRLAVGQRRGIGLDHPLERRPGLAAPAGTPPEIVAVLEEAFSQALNDETVQQTMRDLGMEPVYFSSGDYRTLLEDGREAMATDLAEIGLIDN